jgi:hypothetical protein
MHRRRALGLLRGLAAVAAASLPGGRLLAADRVARLAGVLGGARSFKARVQAAALLGRTGDPRAYAALSQAAASDKVAIVRAAALRELTRSALDEHAPLRLVRLALSRGLSDPEAVVRRQATDSLTELDRGGGGERAEREREEREERERRVRGREGVPARAREAGSVSRKE